MDQEVASTLAALESKLRELERELVSLGQQTSDPAATAAPHVPPSTPYTPPRAPQPPRPLGRLVDEAVEAPTAAPASAPPVRYSMEAQETAFGEIPATRDEHETIDVAELLRFRDKLAHTLQILIDEYDRLLSLGRRS